MTRLVIFDMDGTLIDSQAHIAAAMETAFESQGLTPPNRDEVLSIVGLSLPQAVFRLVPDATFEVREQIVEGYKNSFATRRSRTESPLFPGAMALLQRLDQETDFALAIATGKSRRGLDHVFREHEMGRYFVSTQVADDHPSKPHPSMVETALMETGYAPGDAVMIGDTTFDIEMGRAGGVATIGVGWGYHPKKALIEAGAHRIAETFDELGDLILDSAL